MTKVEYLEELKSKLEMSSVSSVQEVVSFYDEAISDRMDAGMDEEEAVAQVGSVDEIVREVKLNLPMTAVVSGRIKESHETAKKNGMGWLWVVLAIVGCPVWIPLVIASIALVFAVYIVLWSLVFTLFVVLLALAFSGGICLVMTCTVVTGMLTVPTALGSFGAGLVLVSLAIMLWRPVCLASRGLIKMIGGFFRGIKKIFV